MINYLSDEINKKKYQIYQKLNGLYYKEEGMAYSQKQDQLMTLSQFLASIRNSDLTSIITQLERAKSTIDEETDNKNQDQETDNNNDDDDEEDDDDDIDVTICAECGEEAYKTCVCGKGYCQAHLSDHNCVKKKNS